MHEKTKPITTAAIAKGWSSAHLIRMTKRATQRPETFAKPAHWSNDPAPAPAPAKDEPDPRGLSPTRYGDWEQNGIAIDF